MSDRRTAIAAMAAGAFMWAGSFLFIGDILQGRESAHWTRTAGRIESHAVDRDCVSRSSYAAHLAYRYDAAGRTRTGRRITATNRFCFPKKEAAQDFLDKTYPVGAQVDVYYDPESPDDAVLRSGEYARFTYVVVAVLWLASFFLCFAGWRVFRKSRGQAARNVVFEAESTSSGTTKRIRISTRIRVGKNPNEGED